MPRSPGLQIARVAGVPVRLMPSWFVFAAYLVFIGQVGLRERHGDGPAFALAASLVLVLLASVLLHELGHLLVARAFGLPVRSISVTLLAGFTEITEPPGTPAREYAVAIAGPMVSLVLCSVTLVGAVAAPSGSVLRLLLEAAASMNAAITLLNLLPGLPLDGGRVLRSVVWHVGGDPVRATRVGAYAGMALGLIVVPIVIVGILPAYGYGNRGPVTIVVSALIGAFMYAGANAALRHARVESVLPEVTVLRLARPALGVPAQLPLAEAIRQAHEAAVRALVVVDSTGRADGLVSEAWVLKVPEERRPWVSVADGARRLVPELWLDESLAGEALLAAMQAAPASEYLVRGGPLRVLVSADVAAALTAAP